MTVIEHYQHLIDQGLSEQDAYAHCRQRFGQPAIDQALASRETARAVRRVAVFTTATPSTMLSPPSFLGRVR